MWVAAIEGTLAMAERLGDSELSEQAARIAPTARATLNDAYWRPDEGHHAFGILAGGGTNDNLTVWPATAAAFGLLDDDRARSTLALMAGDRVSSDWGAHMLSTESDLYDPLQYNMGTVWPFVTGFASWAQYRYRRPWAGFHLMDAVKQMTFDWSLGRHGELFSGTFYQPLDQTVPHQFFATSMLVTPLLRGVVGWEPDAPNGRARLAPQLPADWDGASVRRLRVGETMLDLDITRRWTDTGGEQRVLLRSEGPPVEIEFVPDVPAGATDVMVTESADGEFAATWQGGLAVAPPRIDLQPGQRSTGLRIIDLTADDGGWLLTLEGSAGRSYDVRLYGTPVDAATDDAAATVSGQSDGTIHVSFEGGEGRTTMVVRLTPASPTPTGAPPRFGS